MTKTTLFSVMTAFLISMTTITASAQKLVSSKTHFKFFSTTPAEDIEANNYKTVGTIETSTGEIVFSVPMQSFEFEKSLMQEHFNSKKFLDTKTNPKAKLVGKISDLTQVDFVNDGSYKVEVKGDLSINGVTKPIKEKVTITVSSGEVALETVFNITLVDYEIAFEKGKPSTNVAKIIEVTAKANY